jgi:Protein of unknown function (DUF2442)
MVVTKDQFKAANARGAAAVARGPVAQAARYDSRRGLIVITLAGGCEFAFPVAMAEGLADAPRSKLRKIKISPNGLGLHWPLLECRSLSGSHLRFECPSRLARSHSSRRCWSSSRLKRSTLQ